MLRCWVVEDHRRVVRGARLCDEHEAEVLPRMKEVHDEECLAEAVEAPRVDRARAGRADPRILGEYQVGRNRQAALIRPPQPSHRKGYSRLACLVGAYVLSQFYRAFLAVLSPDLGRDLGATPGDLALASGLWFLAFAGVLWSLACDGRAIAVGVFEAGTLRPTRVFAA